MLAIQVTLKKDFRFIIQEKEQNLQKGVNGKLYLIKNIPQKKKAMSEEYKLKKNYKLRNKIKIDYLNKYKFNIKY